MAITNINYLYGSKSSIQLIELSQITFQLSLTGEKSSQGIYMANGAASKAVAACCSVAFVSKMKKWGFTDKGRISN